MDQQASPCALGSGLGNGCPPVHQLHEL